MTGLDELRKRVEAAENHFGLMSTQSRKYSERLTRLVSQMEQAHAEQHREIAQLNGRLGQFEQENGLLKAMLMGLLQAIENGSDGVIDHAVRDLEGRIGRLVGAQAAAAPAVEQAFAPAEEQAPAPAAAEAFEAADAEPEAAMTFDVADIGADDVEADDLGADDLVSDLGNEVIEAADADGGLPRPEPETVALDDYPEQSDALTDSANDLLDRVEAAANALLAAGMDTDGDADSELTDEISALLAHAINGEDGDDALMLGADFEPEDAAEQDAA